MNSNSEIQDLEGFAAESDTEDAVSVDDFIRELEAKEKDLHITAETTVIEIAEGFADGELPDFMKGEFADQIVKTVKPAAAAASQKEKATKTKLEAEIENLKETIAKMEAERAEMFKNSQRRAKDFANYKSRTERERRETFQNQVSNLAVQMLPALDNLNRAVDFTMEMPRDEQNEFHQFFDGIVLVNQQVNEVLNGMGIVPIASIGEMFDPHLHEAAATEDTDDFPANTICGELLRGYRSGDRVIRHSVVRVAKPTLNSTQKSGLEALIDPDDYEMPPDQPGETTTFADAETHDGDGNSSDGASD